MKHPVLYIILLFSASAFSQETAISLIGKGNEAYRLQQYDKAVLAYKAALETDPSNDIASFNMGNALFKNKEYAEAAKQFDKAAKSTADKNLQSQLFYNKGVALTQQKKLEESIDAYKQSLRINSTDTIARENLQRAINELKQQQQKEDQDQNQQKEKQDNKPKPKQNKLNKQQVQQLLKALEEKEKKLQEKMMKKAPLAGQPDKDW